MYSKWLLLKQRCGIELLTLISLYIIILIICLVTKKKIKIPSIIIGVIVALVLWHGCFTWRAIRPLEIIFTSNSSFQDFRTSTNKSLVAFPWRAIYSTTNDDELTQVVINQYIQQGGTFDFSKYTYFVTFGFTMLDLYDNAVFTDTNDCVAVMDYQCEPNQILIYRIPHTVISHNEDRLDRRSYYVFK